ncbi:protein of unknown function [Bryocella elongata]|uniref:DUF5063 domain-containing protein n=1 Tax=Bryocella elongata TaxID=863522 RepID=A0A1H5Y3N5_9BACT|nr:DUF5063 domain-containing protein [Bryocella elongata]SEG18156.1 protein of unknown function [Bryocella elongata]
MNERSTAEIYEEFRELAQAYCKALEVGAELSILRTHLLKLYVAAVSLPAIPCGPAPTRDITHDEAMGIFRLIGKKLPIDYYWDTFQPLADPPELAIASSLVDDLTDIWRDLKNGLLALENADAAAERGVWWNWRFSFYSHWGHHAIGALRVLHDYLKPED